MKIAITGCYGSVGRRVVRLALQRGHDVLGLDITEGNVTSDRGFTFRKIDLTNYDDVLDALAGQDAIVQLASLPNPTDYVVKTHNMHVTPCGLSNVVVTWNVLRAAAEHGIKRISMASSVNVVTLVYSQRPRLEYFPIDENHPCLPDEPYGLSKLIAELQADTIVRRWPDMRIASLRLSWSVPERSVAARGWSAEKAANDLWGYVCEDSGADAFLRALDDSVARFSGHEAFFIVAPEVSGDTDSAELKSQFWPDVPIRDGHEIRGKSGFFDCTKAREMLGWVHQDPFTG
ncbi:NAD(P)-binding protein [Cylindrobasidium torrendii FP15055 ss-10]|uniref:NAD(P)-binding protein n=1 Tax=Cylindrobasidium torrendii FP15055 ss-10 TaxID=1314674 RepID=A0A0D7BB46_9AGAR|nr:NAD(P)-binding protein [Cylindrobasidium torrendii FP15055 ss-10]